MMFCRTKGRVAQVLILDMDIARASDAGPFKTSTASFSRLRAALSTMDYFAPLVIKAIGRTFVP